MLITDDHESLIHGWRLMRLFPGLYPDSTFVPLKASQMTGDQIANHDGRNSAERIMNKIRGVCNGSLHSCGTLKFYVVGAPIVFVFGRFEECSGRTN